VAVREILRFPHPALKRVAPSPGPDDWERIGAVAADLVETMRAFPRCVGLAATQIGEPLRLVVVDVSLHPRGGEGNGELVLVDPRVVEREGEELGREGCLSVPELTADVRRATDVVVEALTPAGETRAIRAHGFEARALQHEIDHLDGLLFLDRVDSLTRDVFRRKTT
jgi:peptide deformylase